MTAVEAIVAELPDMEALRRHSCLEVAALRRAMRREIMRQAAALSQLNAESLLDSICIVVDEVAHLELQATLGVYTLLYERMIQRRCAQLDRTVLTHRESLLQLYD